MCNDMTDDQRLTKIALLVKGMSYVSRRDIFWLIKMGSRRMGELEKENKRDRKKPGIKPPSARTLFDKQIWDPNDHNAND